MPPFRDPPKSKQIDILWSFFEILVRNQIRVFDTVITTTTTKYYSILQSLSHLVIWFLTHLISDVEWMELYTNACCLHLLQSSNSFVHKSHHTYKRRECILNKLLIHGTFVYRTEYIYQSSAGIALAFLWLFWQTFGIIIGYPCG